MSLDLYQLRTFYIFCKVRNVTRAAERLYVTQSAVSHSLKKLEASVGRPLVVRRGGDYQLTEVGEMLYRSCGVIFDEVDALEANLKGEGQPVKQRIFLGAPVEFGTTVLVRTMERFFRHHLNFHINFHFSHQLGKMLMTDEADLIIDCHAHKHVDVERIFLFRERYVVIASPEYLRRHGVVGVGDLERVRVISCDTDGSWWNNFLLSYSVEERPRFSEVMQINHVRGMINGALMGLGVAFVPRYTVESELLRGVLNDVFPDETVMDDEFCIYIKKAKKLEAKNLVLINFLIDNFAGFSSV